MTDEKRRILSTRAETDLEDIFVYGVERWGAARTARYLREIDAAFKLLGDWPRIGRLHTDLLVPLRTHLVGSHVVVYRDEMPVQIVRVVHQSSDWQRLMDAEDDDPDV